MFDRQPDFELIVNGFRIPEDEKKYIKDIKFEESIGDGASASLEFKVFEAESSRLLRLVRVFSVGASIEFHIGWVNELEYVFEGEIVQLPRQYSKEEGCFLNIVCFDRSIKMKSVIVEQQSIPSTRSGENPTWLNVVFELIAGYGFEWINIYPPDILDVPWGNTSSVEVGFIKGDFKIEAGRRTYYGTTLEAKDTPWAALVKKMKERGLKTYVRLRELYIVTDDYICPTPPNPEELSLVYRPDELLPGTWPLLDFYAYSDRTALAGEIEGFVFNPTVNDIPGKTDVKQIANPATQIQYHPRQIKTLLGALDDALDRDRFDQTNVKGIATRGQQARDNYEISESLHKFVGSTSEFNRARYGAYAQLGENIVQTTKNVARRIALFAFENMGDIPKTLAALALPVLLKDPYNPTQTHPVTLLPDTIRRANVIAESRDEEIARRKRLAELKELFDHLTTGRGTIRGNPYMRAGQKHNININSFGGFGETDSGVYFITKVSHIIDKEGYRVDFECRRPFISTATGVLGEFRFGPPKRIKT